MDEFLNDIHTILFRKWIMLQSREDFLIHETNDPDIIAIETATSHSEISFNPMNIIELVVTSRAQKRDEFYIHFQMNNLSHAVSLYKEMVECIEGIKYTKKTSVLLSCSSGLTTTMFAEDLNQAARALSLDFEFHATPFTKLFEIGANYDVVLLAPQISFQHAKVIQVLNDPLVIKIPPKIFAKYDTSKMLDYLTSEIDQFQNGSKLLRKTYQFKLPSNNNKILCISIKRIRAPRITINYKLFDDADVLEERVIIKTNISERDIYDIVEVMFAKYPDIEIVGISTLGIVNNDEVYLRESPFTTPNFMAHLRENYQAKFILENDVNCASLGYYVTQNKYHSLSMVTKTRQLQFGGVGSILKGELIKGKFNIAGEVQFLPLDMNHYPVNYEGFVQQLSHSILSVIAVLAPEAIIIYAPVVSDVNDIKKYILNKLPKQFLPDLILIDDITEYSTVGLLQLCIDELEKAA